MTIYRLWILPLIFYICLNFIPKVWGVWILHPKVSEFGSVKFKHSQTLKNKIKILKFQGVKFKYPKLQGIKSKFWIFKK